MKTKGELELTTYSQLCGLTDAKKIRTAVVLELLDNKAENYPIDLGNFIKTYAPLGIFVLRIMSVDSILLSS